MRKLVVTPVVLGILPGCLVAIWPCPDHEMTETILVSDEDLVGRLHDGVLDADECAFFCRRVLSMYEVSDCIVETEEADSGPLEFAQSADSGGAGVELTCTGKVERRCYGRRPTGLRRRAHDQSRNLGTWAADACTMEAASVIAFRRLARDLRRLGAPEDLVQDARRSASDEVRHARAMRRLARAHGVEPRRPRVRATKPPDLRRLARQNLVVGCLQETWAALVACHQAQRAADDEVRREMAKVATDELRHAELAWAIHRWAGRDLGATWSRAVARQRAAVASPVDAKLARDLGVPTGREALRLFDGLVAGLPA